MLARHPRAGGAPSFAEAPQGPVESESTCFHFLQQAWQAFSGGLQGTRELNVDCVLKLPIRRALGHIPRSRLFVQKIFRWTATLLQRGQSVPTSSCFGKRVHFAGKSSCGVRTFPPRADEMPVMVSFLLMAEVPPCEKMFG